ncbi:hypothetical protein OAC41_05525 [Acidimicrobiales bacterium]|nr:hypothetical protein [Acidimicrobiales bacterium]
MCTDTPQIITARNNIGHFIIQQAQQRANNLGFGFIPSDQAPETYEGLQQAYLRSTLTRAPLPVTSRARSGRLRTTEQRCERYDRASEIGYHYVSRELLGPDIGLSALFWHDTNHVRLGASFSLDHEDELADWQLHQLRHAGLRQDTLEYRIMDADTRGQIACTRALDRAPTDTRQFTQWCLDGGLPMALELEATK